MTEKPVPGYEHILISPDGTARIATRVVPRGTNQITIPGRELRGSTTKSGHISLSLTHGRGTKRKKEYLHRLVYQLFVGDIPEGMEVRHLNGDPADNRVENLAVGTRTQQRLDDVRNGVHRGAAKTHCKRGHPLVDPYICPTKKKKGHRICLPCKRALMRKAYHGYSEEQVQAIADQIFLEIQETL